MRGLGWIRPRKNDWKKKPNNPIVWNRMKWEWKHRGPKSRCKDLCLFQIELGEVAYRRLRPPGWLTEQMIMRSLGWTTWPGKGKMLVPEKDSSPLV